MYSCRYALIYQTKMYAIHILIIPSIHHRYMNPGILEYWNMVIYSIYICLFAGLFPLIVATAKQQIL